MATRGLVLTRLLSGRPLLYEFISSAGSVLKAAGPLKLLLGGVAITAASIVSYDRTFDAQRKERVLDPDAKPTALNKLEDKYLIKVDRNPLQCMGLGFYSTFFKPVVVLGKMMTTYGGAPVENSELLSALLSVGIVPMIKNGYQVMASPQMYAKVAEKAAEQAVESAKQRLWRLPWELVTCQVPITKVWSAYQQLRDATAEATRQAATMHTDGMQAFGAMMRYYTTSKLFEFAGGVGAGAVTAFAYNRYLAGPAERAFGPAARAVTRVATFPVRPMISAEAARTLGTLIARRSPLAVLLLLQGLGTLYATQNEFRRFVNDVAESYPEVASQVVKQIKS